MNRMKALLTGSAIAAATTLSALAVSAAPAGDGPASADTPRGPAHHGFHHARGKSWGDHHRRGHRDSCDRHGGGRMERHINLIEGLMNFTPEQETAWTAYKTARTSARESLQKACEARKEEGRSKTAIERLDRFERAMETRLAAMRSVKPAFEKFYGTLSEKQQKAVDGLFTRRGRRG